MIFSVKNSNFFCFIFFLGDLETPIYRRNISGTSTPSGMQTPRKSSAEPTFSSTMRSRTSRGTTPVEKREPFRL